MARPRTGDKERAIIDAAIRLFLERGVRGTTIQDLANLAQVSVGAVYVYYKDKPAIVRSVAYAFAERHRDFAQRVLASRKRPLRKFQDYVLGFYDMWQPFGANAQGSIELAAAILEHAPETPEIARKEFHNAIEHILTEARDAGLRVERPAEEARWIALSMAAFFPLAGTPSIRPLNEPLTREDLAGLLRWIRRKLS